MKNLVLVCGMLLVAAIPVFGQDQQKSDSKANGCCCCCCCMVEKEKNKSECKMMDEKRGSEAPIDKSAKENGKSASEH